MLYADQLLQKARLRFPSGGDAEGRASYELFRDGPLKAAAFHFGRGLRDLPVESGFYVAQTVPTPFFEPMAFYAWVITEAGVDTIEIVDFEVDEGYWDLVENDPAD